MSAKSVGSYVTQHGNVITPSSAMYTIPPMKDKTNPPSKRLVQYASCRTQYYNICK